MEQPDARPDGIRRLAIVGGTVAAVVLVLVMRVAAFNYGTVDSQHFVVGWFNYLNRYGKAAFATRFADYNVPYLYLLYATTWVTDNGLLAIKVISTLADLLLAWGMYRIVAQLRGRRLGALAAFTTLMVPTVWINSAVWGQTDQLYAALALHSVADLLQGRQRRAWLWFGVAFSFKLQAVFILPFLLVVWLKSRDRDWAAPPLAVVPWLLLAAPAIPFGLPWRELLLTYTEQTGGSTLTNAPNLWQIIGLYGDPTILAMTTPLAAGVLALYLVAALLRDRWFLDKTRWLSVAATIAVLLPFLLPGMRNRYYFLAEVLVLAAAFLRPRLWWVAVVLLTAGTYGYGKHLFDVGFPIGDTFSLLPYLVVLVALVRDSLSLNGVTSGIRTTLATAGPR